MSGISSGAPSSAVFALNEVFRRTSRDELTSVASGQWLVKPSTPNCLVVALARSLAQLLATGHRPLTITFYQDDFETPGISPLSASERKHKRQMPNLRK